MSPSVSNSIIRVSFRSLWGVLVAGAETASNYAQFPRPRLRWLCYPRHTGRHNVKNGEADGLVARLVERITVLEPVSADGGY